jgi:DNA-directed RNA polymerase subunit A'
MAPKKRKTEGTEEKKRNPIEDLIDQANSSKEFEEITKRERVIPEEKNIYSESSSKKKFGYESSSQRLKENISSEAKFALEDKIKVDIGEDEKKRNILKENNIRLYNLPEYEVDKIQLYPMSNEEIKTKAVLNITNPNKEYGLTGGLFDKRMGSIINREICITCNRDDHGCSGHFGYIDLPQKFINVMFQKETIYVLQCVCSYCGDTYITEEFFKALNLSKVPKKKLLKTVAELSEKWLYKLHNHGYSHEVYEKNFKGYRLCFKMFGADKASDTTYVRSINVIEKIFSMIPPEKLKLLGFSDATVPLNFIQSTIVCCPPHIRPPGFIDKKAKDHPLTEKYTQILSRIIRLQNHITISADRENELDNLYADIKSIVFGPEKKIRVKSVVKDFGILPGLLGKEGIARKSMIGKRVDNCARTVAGPGYELNFGEAGIPKSFKKTLLVPVIIHKYNYKNVIERYRNGNYKWLKMKLLSVRGLFPIDESKIKKYTPEIGDVLMRPIETGDRGLTGRQPSLHAESILGYNFVVDDRETIKIHSSNNACFNADFDGDEFTIHILQDIMAICECLTVMNFKSHVINVQSSKPMMGLASHGLIGSFLMTASWDIDGIKREVIIPERRWQQAINLVNNSYRKTTLEDRLNIYKIPLRSGRALFSLVLPTNFTYSCPHKSGLKIIDGILVRGILKKSNLGNVSMALVQIIAKMYSIKEACRFINDTQILADWFTMWHGLSIGYKDFNANRTEVVKMLKKELIKMQIELFNLGPRPDDSIEFFFWMRSVHGILDKSKILGKEIGEKFLSKNNCLNILGEDGSGAKGSSTNTSQITGSLGEQFVGSSIPIYNLKNETRCLPFFVSNDVSVESIGYIYKSFMDGINLSECIFHNTSSRLGLIDTAKNTAEVGYTHRRVGKSLEPITINWFGSSVSTDGRLFQLLFGSGFDISKLLTINTVRSGKKMFFVDFNAEVELLNRIHERKNEIIYNKIIEDEPTVFEKFTIHNRRRPKFSELIGTDGFN